MFSVNNKAANHKKSPTALLQKIVYHLDFI